MTSSINNFFVGKPSPTFPPPVLRQLELFSKGEIILEKEVLQRNLKLVLNILTGVSELMEPERSADWESVLSTNLRWLENVNLKIGGEGVRGGG